MTPAFALAPLQHDPDAVRRATRDTLARPEFADREPGPVSRGFEQVLEWIAGLLDGIVDGVGSTSVGAWIVVAVGTALLVAVVWRITRSASVDRRRVAMPDGPLGRSAAEWRTEAARHTDAGRHAEALRASYRAAVTELVEAEVIDEVPGRTVSELDERIATADPSLAPAFAAAGRALDAVWYGDQPVTDDHRAVVAAADEAARQRTRRGRRTTAALAADRS